MEGQMTTGEFHMYRPTVREVQMPRADGRRCFEVVVPTTYLVFTDASGEPDKVSLNARPVWGIDVWNSRGRYLGKTKPAVVKRICDALRSFLRNGARSEGL